MPAEAAPGPVETLLADDVDVECPTCGARAVIRPTDPGDRRWLGAGRRMVCGACGLVRSAEGATVTIHDDGRDPWFHQPVWWRLETGRGVLWAYHRRHLDELRTHVAATHRPAEARAGWRSTLPAWITSASHRLDVLRDLDRMAARR